MRRINGVVCCAAALLAVCLISATPVARGAAQVPDASFDFGTAVQGKIVTHQFVLRNDSSTAVRIRRLTTGPALVVGRLPAHIGPGADVTIPVQIDTSGLTGPFKASIAVALDDPTAPEMRLTVTGRVITPIEITPMPALFAATRRGEPKAVSVEIRNHEADPLMLEALEHPTDRFTTRLETLEAGRRYRLHLTLNPDGPSGAHQESIRIRTSRGSTLTIPAYTKLRERVYTFPNAVDLGRLRLAEVEARPDVLAETAQTLMVYRLGRSDLEVTMRTDVPELDLRWERGPQGDRYQATVTLLKEKLRPGPITGSIVIQTNDTEFPTLTVPVSGAILPR